MFVTNHVLSGVVIGRALTSSPSAAFIAGVASHLVVDMIPHWSCDSRAEGGEERFLRAARKDGLLGLAALAAFALAVEAKARPAVIAGMAGAVFLDLDKPAKHFFGVNPFPPPVRRLHSWVQRQSESGMRNEVAFGAMFALVNAAVAVRSRKSATRESIGAI